VGAAAKSPSPLAPFAYDWVGGDIHGLSAYAGTLYRYVPEISDVTGALTSKVSAVVNAAGWQGQAASAFTRAWERDSVAAGQLSSAITACGNVVDVLAVNLAKIENALEHAAGQASAHGVPLGANGGPPQVCLANAAEESWRASYQSFYNQCMLAATAARTQAAAALQSLFGQLTRAPAKNGPGGLSNSDRTAGFDVLAGFLGAQTRYSHYVEGKIPELKQAVSQAITTAREEARLANGRFGPWTDQGKADFGTARTELAGVQNDLAGAQSSENWFSKTWGVTPSDIPGVASAVSGLDGSAGSVARLAADIPFVDIAAAGAGTYFSAQQDMQAGVPGAVAYPAEAAGNVAGLAAGGYVGGLAMGATAGGLATLGAGAGITATLAGGAGVLAGGAVAFGVGDLTHHLIDENWGQDISQNGVVLGIGKGIGDSFVNTGKDIGNIASSVWNSIF
jgi:uncharacterized protein YukE